MSDYTYYSHQISSNIISKYNNCLSLFYMFCITFLPTLSLFYIVDDITENINGKSQAQIRELSTLS